MARDEALHGGDTAFEGVISLQNPLRADDQAALPHGARKRQEPGLGRVEPARPGDEAHARVAKGYQMLDGLTDSLLVIDLEDADARAVGTDIDENERNLAFGQLVEKRLLDAEGHHGHALDFALDHSPDAVVHALGVVVGGAHEDFVAVLDGDIFKALNQFGKEGIGDFGDEQAEEAAAAGDEGAGLGVGDVVELANHLPDALCHFSVDGAYTVHGARDGGDGDIGQAGDGANVGLLILAGGFCTVFVWVGAPGQAAPQ